MPGGPWRWIGVCALVACQSDGVAPAAGEIALDAGEADGDAVHARAWLEAAAPLPARAEVVALTDRLAIAASHATGTEAARMSALAGALRERLWRLDRVGSDGREAIELYASAAASDDGCEHALRRAVLAGEIEGAPAIAYRELYLASRREQVRGAGKEVPEQQACLDRFEALLDAADAYRPSGGEWQRLVADGEKALPPLGAGTARQTDVAPNGSASAAPVESGDVLIAPSVAAVGDRASELTRVEPYSYELGGRVVLSLTEPARYEVGVLPPDGDAGRGHRIYLDLLRTKAKGVKTTIAASGLIERVRVGKRDGGTRVVLDLSAPAYKRVFYLPHPFRVVIDLGTRAPAPATPVVARGGKRTLRRVVLDPGHGGTDTGAVGPTGLAEKDVALDVAHRAAPAIAAELGIETMLTRDTDLYVPLEERTARANAYHADLFVSIHCNATENGAAQGVELYVLDPGRESDALARRTAARENSAGRRAELDQIIQAARTAPDNDLFDVAAGLNRSIGGADLTQSSRTLAELLRRSTLSSLGERYPGTHDHGIKTASFFVLMGAEMPAVLLETAFVTNPEDEARLATADFRQKLADAVVNAVKAYRDGVE